MPGDGMDGMPGFPAEIQPETIGQKILRFLKGLFGLGSAKQENENIYPMPAEGEQVPPGQIKPVVPIPGGKG